MRLSVIRAADDPPSRPLRLASLDLAAAEHPAGWISGWQRPRRAAIVTVLEGELLVELRHDGARLGPGDVAFLSPGTDHCLHALLPSVVLHLRGRRDAP